MPAAANAAALPAMPARMSARANGSILRRRATVSRPAMPAAGSGAGTGMIGPSSLARVFGPAIPSTASPAERWKASTAPLSPAGVSVA